MRGTTIQAKEGPQMLQQCLYLIGQYDQKATKSTYRKEEVIFFLPNLQGTSSKTSHILTYSQWPGGTIIESKPHALLQVLQKGAASFMKTFEGRLGDRRRKSYFSFYAMIKRRKTKQTCLCSLPQQAQYGNIEADFAMAISLYHGFELLQLHGLRSLYNFMTGIIAGEKGYGRTRSELLRNADFNDIMETLREKFLGSGTHG